ncbi:glycoside hydrolase family 28 protein [Zunongwangia sp. F363]|uniref:Glycoside hydrolase family 28 protein n=1 Tax=Autumnicola tepida TaxID=3075595 RepID=A0ABU3C8Z0_9FLAO|nr:glycoside hydrolase family 28 protein [Zunongwangia sp. F363]MDT0642766.1 glycoside hydrolase family 28 protein [Zunongwangia sp. F363]
MKKVINFLMFISVFMFLQMVQAQEEYLHERIINIKDFKAVDDGSTLNTGAIQNAIDYASRQKSGATVLFEKGQYLSGTIELKSNVELYFQEGAVLLGSTNPENYRKVEVENVSTPEKTNDNSRLAFLIAENAKNIALSGKGTIDGQGRKVALTIDSLHHSGIKIDPNYDYGHMRPNETVRPKIIDFMLCDNVKVSGLRIKNSAGWVQSYEICNNVQIKDIAVESRAYWNNDGIGITDCTNVRITGCDVNSADDGIVIKSYYRDYINDSIYIGNCTIRSSASAVKFGTASYSGFKNITIENIEVYDTFRSAVALESVDGGIIENIQVSNITAKNTWNPIFVRLGHRGGEKPGIIRNVHFKNIDVEVPFGRPDVDYDMRGPEVKYSHNQFPAPITGIPGHPIENITFENIKISYPGRASKGMAYVPIYRLDQVKEKIKKYPEYTMFGELPSWGFYVRHTENVSMKNIKLSLRDSDFRPAFVFDDIRNLKLEDVVVPSSEKGQVVFKNVEEYEVDPKLKEELKVVKD